MSVRKARHRYVVKRSTTWRFSMKRIVIDSMPDLFQRVRLTVRPSSSAADPLLATRTIVGA